MGQSCLCFRGVSAGMGNDGGGCAPGPGPLRQCVPSSLFARVVSSSTVEVLLERQRVAGGRAAVVRCHMSKQQDSG